MTDMNYCKECGNKINIKAEICTKCGCRQVLRIKKSKKVAIILAIFFSQWTWIYTYKYDAWKFWMGMIITVTLVILWAETSIAWMPSIITMICSITDQAIKPKEFWDNY